MIRPAPFWQYIPQQDRRYDRAWTGVSLETQHRQEVRDRMTNLGDVVRQIETALGDPHYPPTGHERVVYISILLLICNGAVDAKGSR